jgi:hypothetical protein
MTETGAGLSGGRELVGSEARGNWLGRRGRCRGTFLRILLCAGVTGSAFGAVDENAVHLPFIDVHQQNSTVPAEKVNRVGAGRRRLSHGY